MIRAELGKAIENYIQKLVDTGRYGSKSEVLREGVRLIQDRETRFVALDASIMRGVADADANSTRAAEHVSGELRTRYESVLSDNHDLSTGPSSGPPEYWLRHSPKGS